MGESICFNGNTSLLLQLPSGITNLLQPQPLLQQKQELHLLLLLLLLSHHYYTMI